MVRVPDAMKREMRNKAIIGLLFALAALMVCAHLRLPYNARSYRLTKPAASTRNSERPEPVRYDGDVDVNRASAQELCELPGVGPSLAQEIISERERNGTFYYPEDLINVKGIGEKTLQNLIRRIKLP